MSENGLGKLRLIYQEANESYKAQQGTIDTLNNKFNWIIVSDIGLLALLFSKGILANNFLNFSLFALLSSLIFSAISLWTRKYKRGALLTELLNATKYSEEEILEGLNKKMVEAINLNVRAIDELSMFLKVSIVFLVISVISLLLSIIV